MITNLKAVKKTVKIHEEIDYKGFLFRRLWITFDAYIKALIINIKFRRVYCMLIQ